MLAVDFSSSSKEPQRSQALRRSKSKMSIDPSNASADKRASTEAFSSADMPSANRRGASTHFRRFDSDEAIEELCNKMAENRTLFEMGKELLESLRDARSKFDAKEHFAKVKKIWGNAHFNCLLYKTLEDQDSFLHNMIQYRLKQQGQFQERISRMKKYRYFEFTVKVREPAAMMRGLLLILIWCWSCKDEYAELDKEERCTVAVKAPDNDYTHVLLKRFESMLLRMKKNRVDDDIIRGFRSEMESSHEKERCEFSQFVYNLTERARDWLWEGGSPIPQLLDEPFIMVLAVELEKKNNDDLVAKAKWFLEKLASLDPADGGSGASLVGEEHSKKANEVLNDQCFLDVLREITGRDAFLHCNLSALTYAHERRELSIRGDAGARMVRMKKDPFCADILKESEGAAVLRGFLIILFGYYFNREMEDMVVEFHNECHKGQLHLHESFHYRTRFAGDVEGLEKALERQVEQINCDNKPLFRKIRCLQFQREVLHRNHRYDVHGVYRVVFKKDGSFVRSTYCG